MNEDQQQQQLQPLIIVKRVRAHHDEHHGGVWKIAFADFMTAMMAFFLVMWLINASNDETRSQVASYFNPVKLTDAVAGPKGVRSSAPFVEVEEHDDKNGQGGEAEKQSGHSGSGEEASDEKSKEAAEQELFQDPYAVLIEIAGQRSSSVHPEGINTGDGRSVGTSGGDAFRDPFEPAFWLPSDAETDGSGNAIKLDTVSELAKKPDKSKVVGTKTMVVQEAAEQKSTSGQPAVKLPMKKAVIEMAKTPEMGALQTLVDEKAMPADGKKPTNEPAKPSDGATRSETSKPEQEAAQLKAEIMAAVDITGADRQPALSVEKTQEGLVVSLTDDLDFGMFGSASARPNVEMVQFMDQIASVLAKRPGQLIVRGHTDSRPFRSDAYDNWRLSTARAHMAYHMLVRGGVVEERFERIEGHADRSPRNKSDTEAAENRRIEILLVEKKS